MQLVQHDKRDFPKWYKGTPFPCGEPVEVPGGWLPADIDWCLHHGWELYSPPATPPNIVAECIPTLPPITDIKVGGTTSDDEPESVPVYRRRRRGR